ncbi:MraY family glycosyltransferase [Thalassospira sp.]|uniref:MraY family glycosyltransferase n=1 Tax=Thalassospira sp. TaxID=1912094 RepID=UPI003AA7C415
MTFAGLATFASIFVISSMLLTWGVLNYLRRKAILDMPNHRSSHVVPTPRGGGLAVTPLLIVLVAGVFVFSGDAMVGDWLMLVACGGLGLLSWVDDRHDLSAAKRFALQFVAVIIGMLALDKPVLGGLVPIWLDHVVVVLAWVWFINLFNFMDGIDGITGVEAGSIGLGIFILALFVPLPQFIGLGYIGLGILAIMIGFLIWNWHPAKLFLGDVGSIPLGFVLGWMLLKIAAEGAWAIALILPSYYLFDATFTLIKRAVRREKIWQAHREHFYQKATQRGFSHAKVSAMILVGNLILVALCFVQNDTPDWVRVMAAFMVVLGLIGMMVRMPVRKAPDI